MPQSDSAPEAVYRKTVPVDFPLHEFLFLDPAPPRKKPAPKSAFTPSSSFFSLHRQSFPDPKVGIVPAPMLTSNRIYATGAPKPKPYGVTGEGSGSISPACSRLDAAYNPGECGGRNAPQVR